MTRNDALMTRARRLDPIPSDAFEGYASSAEAEEILDRVLAQSQRSASTSGVKVSRPLQGLHIGATARRILAVGVAAVIVLGVVTLAGQDENDDPRWPQELVSTAQASPRYLMDKEGWTVRSVYESRSDYGEMIFQNSPDAMLAGAPPGQYWVSLNWYPSDMYDHYVADRRRGATASWKITIAGHDALLFKSGPTVLGSTFYALWLEDGHSLELRSDVIPTVGEFKELAATLQPVDVDTWLSALPDSVVTPDERAGAVDRILAQLPVPAGLDVEALKQSNMVKEDYSLDLEVRDSVVCAWIQQWIDGTKSGNEDAVNEAAVAVAWRGWSADSIIADIAAAMKTKNPVNGNQSLPIGVTYQKHMGCPEG